MSSTNVKIKNRNSKQVGPRNTEHTEIQLLINYTFMWMLVFSSIHLCSLPNVPNRVLFSPPMLQSYDKFKTVHKLALEHLLRSEDILIVLNQDILAFWD